MKKIILDLDTGIDDALAILYTLGEKNADLLAITTTYGNVDLELATENSLSILDLANRPDIPVYKGAAHKLTEATFKRRTLTEEIHGLDGLGDADIPKSKRQAEKIDAVDYLIQAAERYEDELTIVTAGPLTNLANALAKNKTALHKVDRFIVMGGALTVPGNTTPFSEANIAEDPEAAEKVFTSGLPLEVVGLDVTMRTILTDTETEELRALNTDRAEWIAKMTNYYFDSYRERLPHVTGCALHDPLAVGVALYPELVKELPLALTVDTKEPTRGRIIGDMEKLNEENPKTKVALEVDDQRFLALFMESLKNVLS